MPPHFRVARPVSDLARARRQYCEGLGLDVLGGFEDHAGFDGAMLGYPGAGFHLEFTQSRDHAIAPTPTVDDLLVFYVPDQAAWDARCEAMTRAGFRRVPSFNPYWDVSGATFEDDDGYRTVIQRAAWGAAGG